MRHKLYLDDYTQIGKNRITLPKDLADYYGNSATAYVNGRQVLSKTELDGTDYELTFTTQTPTKEIEIGRGNLELGEIDPDKVDILTNSGTWIVPSGVNSVEVVVVGGGGGGGSYQGGGGGAGGLRHIPNYSVTSGQSVSVTIGYGGNGGSTGGASGNQGLNGGESSFGSISASGGGGGAGASYPGSAGGSGGGGGTSYSVGGAGNSGGYSPVEGYGGGTGGSYGGIFPGGGGGGASESGHGATGIKAGDGGNGVYIYDRWLAGGGGGTGYRSTLSQIGLGGLGGGGAGGSSGVPGEDGTANTGGGGGCGGYYNALTHGGNGGSGIVIVNYSGIPMMTNDVNILYWTPSTESKLLLFFTDDKIPFEISGILLSKIKVNEEKQITTESNVKNNEETQILTNCQVKNNEEKQTLTQSRVLEAKEESLITESKVFERSTAESVIIESNVKKNEELQTLIESVVKNNEETQLLTKTKVVDSFESYFVTETKVKEFETKATGIIEAKVKGYETVSGINIAKIKENLVSSFLTLVRVIEEVGKSRWDALQINDVTKIIPGYVHGISSVGFDFSRGLTTTELRNNTLNLDYKIVALSDTNNKFVNDTAYCKNNGIALAVIPCNAGDTFTLTLDSTYQIRTTDEICLYEFLTTPQNAFDGSSNIVSTESTPGREISLTTTSGRFVGFGIKSAETRYFKVDFNDFELKKTNSEEQRGKMELPDLHGLDGEFSDLDEQKVICEEGVTTTTTHNGEVFVAINESTGVVTWGNLSGEKTTGLTGSHTIIYVLSEAIEQEQKADLMSLFTSAIENNYFSFEYAKDEFSGDGTTTEFDLSGTTDNTNYTVYVAGIPKTSGVTKTTTNITFDSAPKRGAIIEAVYNRAINESWFAELDGWMPTGTQVELDAPTRLSISTTERYNTRTDARGETEREEQDIEYSITLDASLVEDAQSLYDAWKDKKFRMIIENERGTAYEKDIASVCEIDRATKDTLEATQEIVINSTDYYEGVETE